MCDLARKYVITVLLLSAAASLAAYNFSQSIFYLPDWSFGCILVSCRMNMGIGWAGASRLA